MSAFLLLQEACLINIPCGNLFARKPQHSALLPHLCCTRRGGTLWRRGKPRRGRAGGSSPPAGSSCPGKCGWCSPLSSPLTPSRWRQRWPGPLSSVGPPWLGCSLPVNQERRRVNRNSIGGHTNANPSSYWMEIKGQRWWCCVSRIYAGQSCPLGAIFPPVPVKYRTEKCIWMGLKWYCLIP